MRDKIRGLLAVLLCLFVMNSHAVVVKNLYSTSVAVNSHDAQDRNKALGQALEQVFIKVSGSRALTDLPEIQATLRRADRYLSTYSYIDNPDFIPDNDILPQTAEILDVEEIVEPDVDVEPVVADPAPNLPFLLQVSFRQSLVDDVLRSSGASRWSDNRPVTLVWIVIDDPAGRRVPAEEDQDMIQLIQQSADERALPLIFPLYDLEDRAALSLDSLWLTEQDKIAEASVRYAASGVLVGKMLGTSDGKWRSNWDYLSADPAFWEFECELLADCMQPPVEAVADLLSARYGVVSNEGAANRLSIDVAGLADFESYGSLLLYLQNLIAVREVIVNGFDGSTVHLELVLDGESAQLYELMALNKQLQYQDTGVLPEPTGRLYQWLPGS
ncbi:MAG: DUF2066 domain-containing protein [Pseudomonadales bacterium]